MGGGIELAAYLLAFVILGGWVIRHHIWRVGLASSYLESGCDSLVTALVEKQHQRCREHHGIYIS